MHIAKGPLCSELNRRKRSKRGIQARESALPRRTINFYLLRTGCQWRLLPHEFPPWVTVYHYFRRWENDGVWVLLHRALYERTRAAAGRALCPSVVIMDGQSVKTAERGGARGFDGHKRVKGRKRTSWWILWGCPSPTAWNQPTPPTGALRRACWLG